MALGFTNPTVTARKLLLPEQVGRRAADGRPERRRRLAAGRDLPSARYPRGVPAVVEAKVWPTAAHRDPGAPVEALTPEEEALPPPEWSEADLPVLESAEWELLPHELEGKAVAMRVADGYVNATAMCQAAGKQFSDFARLDTTEAYFNELSSRRGIPRLEMTLIRQGGRPLEQGTWIHPFGFSRAGDVVLSEIPLTSWLEEWRSGKLAMASPHPRLSAGQRLAVVNQLNRVLVEMWKAQLERETYRTPCGRSPDHGARARR